VCLAEGIEIDQNMRSFEIIVFCQNRLGGVQNYYQNLIGTKSIKSLGKCTIIYAQNENDPQTRLLNFLDDPEIKEIVFSYHAGQLFHDICKRVIRLLGNEPGVVFTSFPFELSVLQHYPTNKSIVFVAHDEWYIQTAVMYSFLIDSYIAHNSEIYDLLIRILPDRKAEIYYLPYGVKIPHIPFKEKKSERLKILFIGRLHVLKGIYDLPKIDSLLKESNTVCDWTIVGDGPEKENFLKEISHRANFQLKSPETNAEVMNIAMENDIFILPSRLDGLPVSLLEAMSVGLVPLISDFNKGIHSIVKKEAGFIFPAGANQNFSQAILTLKEDQELLKVMSIAARRIISEDYDIEKNVIRYADFIEINSNKKSTNKTNLPIKYSTGRLDSKYIPVFFSMAARNIQSALKRIFKK